MFLSTVFEWGNDPSRVTVTLTTVKNRFHELSGEEEEEEEGGEQEGEFCVAVLKLSAVFSPAGLVLRLKSRKPL